MPIGKIELKTIGKIEGGRYSGQLDCWKKVYDQEGCSPCVLTSVSTGTNDIKFIEDDMLKIRSGVKCGYEEADIDDGVNLLFPQSDNRRGRVQKGMSPTLQTTYTGGIVMPDFRIRKLTEIECFRLQGVKDEDSANITKGLSSGKQYHLAGDSITTTVLMGIFGQLFMDEEQWLDKINEVVKDVTKDWSENG